MGCTILEVMTSYELVDKNLSLVAWPLPYWVKKEALKRALNTSSAP